MEEINKKIPSPSLPGINTTIPVDLGVVDYQNNLEIILTALIRLMNLPIALPYILSVLQHQIRLLLVLMII